MKTFFLTALTALALTAPACRSSRHLLTRVPTAPIANRLPPLELAAELGTLVNNDGALPEDPTQALTGEMHTNVVELTDTATYGYVHLTIPEASSRRTGKLVQFMQFVTLFTPTLIGVPLETYRSTVKANLEITDAQGKLLGNYAAVGQGKARVAAYYGYSQKDAPRLADVTALQNALANIRPQLDTAVARLRPLLLAGGPVDHPTLPAPNYKYRLGTQAKPNKK